MDTHNRHLLGSPWRFVCRDLRSVRSSYPIQDLIDQLPIGWSVTFTGSRSNGVTLQVSDLNEIRWEVNVPTVEGLPDLAVEAAVEWMQAHNKSRPS